jgi:hypothetical protein
MKTLEERSTRELKIVAAMCYGTAAVIVSGVILLLVTWHLTWPTFRNCAGITVIAGAFIFAGMRNQRMAHKRQAEAVQPSSPPTDTPVGSN